MFALITIADDNADTYMERSEDLYAVISKTDDHTE